MVAVFFGFTHCPDICPTSLTELKMITEQLDQPEKFKVLFVSVDPGRDTVDELKNYIPRFGENMTGLTGSADQIKKSQINSKYFIKLYLREMITPLIILQEFTSLTWWPSKD